MTVHSYRQDRGHSALYPDDFFNQKFQRKFFRQSHMRNDSGITLRVTNDLQPSLDSPRKFGRLPRHHSDAVPTIRLAYPHRAENFPESVVTGASMVGGSAVCAVTAVSGCGAKTKSERTKPIRFANNFVSIIYRVFHRRVFVFDSSRHIVRLPRNHARPPIVDPKPGGRKPAGALFRSG